MNRVHYLSGVIISIFVGIHLFNHIYSLLGPPVHLELMNGLRVVYRNIIAETILLLAVGVQIISGIKLFKTARKKATHFFDQLQIWSGLYLSIFLIFHLGAVLSARFILNLDTNFYFGVAGLNIFPLNLFFFPYYSIAILSFFGHISAVHSKKMKRRFLGIEPFSQACGILIIGIIFTLVILYGLTNGFSGVEIPNEYNIMNLIKSE